MRMHVSSCAPLEGCGLLAGKDNMVAFVMPISNQTRSRTQFRMDPVEQLRAFSWMESEQLELIGIYHSHPTGPQKPSITDIQEAAYEVVQVIWFPTGEDWHAVGFWIENSRASEVELCIEDVQSHLN